MVTIICFFILIILWGFKIDKKESYSKALSYESTLVIKGICSVEIIIGHIGLELSDKLILYPFRKAGVLIVGIFFFISGYGLMQSLIHKKNYLEHFIKKRLLIILIPVGIVCILSSVLFTILFQNEDKNIWSIIVQILSSINWFIWEIIIYYVLFGILYKKFNTIDATKLMFLSTVCIISICYVIGMDNPWYGSNLCFPLGIFVANNMEVFEKWNKKKGKLKTLVLVLLLFISIVLFYILPEHSIVGSLLGRNLAAVCFTLLVINVLSKLQIGNKLTKFLGDISFEVYLIHPLVISCLHSSIIYIKNDLIYAWLVIALSVLFGYLLKQIDQGIKSKYIKFNF